MKRKTGKELLVFCVLMAFFVASGATAASTVGTLDGNDTHGRLDIRRIVHGHRLTGDHSLIRHRLSSRRRWYTRHLQGNPNFINMFLNTDRDKRPERRLTIDVRGNRLFARMDRFPSVVRVGYADVWRPNKWSPNKWSVSVAFPKSFLGQGVMAYGWYANTFFHTGGDGPCGTPTDVVRTCVDRAPNRGLIKHRL